jgi:hypothetical protein
VHTGVLAVFLKLFVFIGDKYLNVRKIRSLDIEERRYHEAALRLVVFTESTKPIYYNHSFVA